jgi:hypothetical protein
MAQRIAPTASHELAECASLFRPTRYIAGADDRTAMPGRTAISISIRK